jgi:pimeloyl-ACP methyl ester carboxylesterase
MDFFSRGNVWPAVRKTMIEYHAPAFPGDVLRFQQTLLHLGRTSFTLRQIARRVQGDTLLATAELLFVCVDREGRPVPVPSGFDRFMLERPATGSMRRITVNGVTLAVEVRGEGPSILFIHGYPLDHSIWEHQVRHLTGWTRIAPDLRGMGQSDAPDLGYSMATYAEDLLALLDALGVGDVVLCGLSMGGYIAFEILRRARDRIRGLILVATRAEADTVEGRKGRDASAAQAREGGATAIAEAMLPRVLARANAAQMPALVDRVRVLMSGTPVAGILGALAAMRDRPDSTALLPRLAGLATLVVVGDDDQIIPLDTARAMADAIPGARLAVVSEAGHFVSLEQPDETTALLRAFLHRIEPVAVPEVP